MLKKKPDLFISSRYLVLSIPQMSFHHNFHKEFRLKAYKVQLTQQLKPADHQQRRVFAAQVLEMHENDPEFQRKIILTDEAHSHHVGYVNKQNCRIWGPGNPRIIIEKPLRPQRITVWRGLWYGGAILLYFFKNEA